MFGISFWKILLLAAVIAAVWFGFRWFQQWEKARRASAETPAERLGRRSGSAEDLVLCRTCGSYIAANAPRCARRDCPIT